MKVTNPPRGEPCLAVANSVGLVRIIMAFFLMRCDEIHFHRSLSKSAGFDDQDF
jgi:hypothetical protein